VGVLDGLVCVNVGHLSFAGIIEPSGHFLVVDGLLLLSLVVIPGVTIPGAAPPQVPLGDVRNL
jgi:hypothetical protein